jgi:hypothetical protein
MGRKKQWVRCHVLTASMRRTNLSIITWGDGVPEKRVFFPFPVAVPLPLFLLPAVDCLFVEPRARRLKSIFNG